MKTPIEGFSEYTALLLASLRQPVPFHHSPALQSRIRTSSISEREINALLRTPPVTTIQPIIQTKSWHSNVVSFLPAAALNKHTANLNSSSNGSGPEDLPPKVINRAPVGRNLDSA